MAKPPKHENDSKKEEPIVHGRCSRCGKPVTGFPGDYAKCRACKCMTMLPADPPPGWRLVRDHEKLRILPFFFVILFYASMVAIAWTGGGTDLAGGVMVILVFAMWIYSIMVFSKAAERQKGRWVPVVEYHVASFAMLPCFYELLPGCYQAFQGSIKALFSLGFLGAFVGLFLSFLIYGDARRRVAHLRIVRLE